MQVIKVSITIHAPIERVFDNARDIGLHLHTTRETGERAIAGKTSGLIELGESVTWEARHLGIRQTLTAKITEFDRPNLFVDEMTDGAFKWMKHTHRFFHLGDGVTRMDDELAFAAPLGILGRIAEVLVLRRHLERLLVKRNAELKRLSEDPALREDVASLH